MSFTCKNSSFSLPPKQITRCANGRNGGGAMMIRSEPAAFRDCSCFDALQRMAPAAKEEVEAVRRKQLLGHSSLTFNHKEYVANGYRAPPEFQESRVSLARMSFNKYGHRMRVTAPPSASPLPGFKVAGRTQGWTVFEDISETSSPASSSSLIPSPGGGKRAKSKKKKKKGELTTVSGSNSAAMAVTQPGTTTKKAYQAPLTVVTSSPHTWTGCPAVSPDPIDSWAGSDPEEDSFVISPVVGELEQSDSHLGVSAEQSHLSVSPSLLIERPRKSASAEPSDDDVVRNLLSPGNQSFPGRSQHGRGDQLSSLKAKKRRDDPLEQTV